MVELGMPKNPVRRQEAQFTYPPGYESAPIRKQIREIARAWSGICRGREAQETAKRLLDQPLPEGADGLYAFLVVDENDYESTIPKLIKKMARRLGSYSTLICSPEGIPPLRRHRKTNMVLQNQREIQGSNIVVLPAQTGRLYSGLPTSEVENKLGENEVDMGILEAGSVLLADPERLQTIGDLFLDCVADMWLPHKGSQICRTPYFGVNERGNLVLSSHAIGSTSIHYGAGSIFSDVPN